MPLDSKSGPFCCCIKHYCPVDTTSADNASPIYIWQDAEPVREGEGGIFLLIALVLNVLLGGAMEVFLLVSCLWKFETGSLGLVWYEILK